MCISITMVSLSVLSLLVTVAAVSSQPIPDDLSALFELEEQSPPQSFIGNVAQGAGLQNILNSSTLLRLEYGFIPEPDNDYIRLEPTTGNLRTQEVIDREVLCPGEVDCYINVGIGILKPSELFQVISVQVKVLDTNDQAPVFTPSHTKVKFSEADPVGTTRTLPIALDLDSPHYGIKEYRMGMPVSQFDLLQVDNPISGLTDLKLRLTEKLDREEQDSYTLSILALDSGVEPLVGNLVVEVSVEDDNDHSPRFGNDLYTVEVAEDFAANRTFFTIQATDNDQGLNSQVIYGLSSRTQTMHGDLFAINQTSGELSLKKGLDFENKQVYHLEVTATDLGSNPQTGLTTVNVQVLDVNDNSPEITISTLTQGLDADVMENLPRGQITAHVSVFDADSGRNGEVMCSLAHPMFELESLRVNQYKIITALPLNREETARYVLNVQCTDLASSPFGAKQNITVIVLDQNDNTPEFRQTSYSGAVPENLPENGYIAMVNATDGDTGDNARLTFEIVEQDMGQYVRIESSSGVMTAARLLDYEAVQELRFNVRVTDHGDVPLSAEASVVIRLMDQNDEAPRFLSDHYLFHVDENEPDRTLVGNVKAVDRDSPPYNIKEYSVFRKNSLDQSLFSIDRTSGDIYTTRSLNHEERSVYYLSVMATDIDVPTYVGSATVTIMVQDINDNAPVIHFPMEKNSTFPISNRVLVGYNITKIFATDPDEGRNGNISFSIIAGNRNGNFRIDRRLGYIQTNTDLVSVTYREYKLRIKIQDEGTPSLSTSVEITVTVDENVPYFSDDTPSGGIVHKTNLTIIIVVAAVSGFVIVILVIAIVVLKMTDCRRPGIFKKPPSPGDKSPKVFSDLNIKAVEANGYLQHQYTRPIPGIEANPRKIPAMETPAIVSTEHEHKMMAETDTHSLSSADVSNPDSGRGGSDEGETSRQSLSPGRQKSSQRSSVHSNRSSIPSQSQHLHGYQHSPRYQTSEASYNSSHSGHVAGHVTNNPNNMDYMSHQCTPEKPKRDSQTPCSIDASNGAHGHNGYRDNVSNHGYERPMHNTDPPPYHQANKHGDKNSYHGNSHNQQNGAWTSHRNSSHGHPSLRPPPSRPLKAVNV